MDKLSLITRVAKLIRWANTKTKTKSTTKTKSMTKCWTSEVGQAYQVGKHKDKDKVNDKAVEQVLFHVELGLIRLILGD